MLSGPVIQLALGVDPIASLCGHCFDDGDGYIEPLFGWGKE